MKLLVIAIGSLGDTAPFTGLGVRLRDVGHEVTVATHPMHEKMILDAGLGFRLVPGDPRDLSTTEQGRDWQSDGKGAGGLVKFLKIMRDSVRMYNEGIEKAALQGADMLILSGTAINGYHVAEGMGIPSICTTLVPTLPAADFPPPLMCAKSLGRFLNKTLSSTMTIGISRMLGKPTNELRARLGLPPLTITGLLRRWREDEWPVLHGVSPVVLPRSREWGPGLQMTGYWWPERPSDWTPSGELVDFLAEGPPPVFVSFGSNLPKNAGNVSEVVSTALRRAGVRGIVQAGWAGLEAINDDILSVGTVPYDWLFPRLAGAVHHGGAGTSAAVLRARIPSVPVPAIVDQAFWAERLRKLGVSPGPLPVDKLDTDRLTAAIRLMLDEPSYRAKARELGDRIQNEDGAGEVVRVVERVLDRHRANARPMP
jgi:sterol 3beta-glucosyltransferase